jgi:poly [ADP-ribose] polymerase
MMKDAKTFTVVEDFNAKLNQTNVAANNNKYYFIQLLAKGGKTLLWTRWGRVGDAKSNQSKLDGPFDDAKGKKEFASKFASKTSNKWADRASFKAKTGKYTLIDVDESEAKGAKANTGKAAVSKTTLDKDVAEIMKVILDQDMFKKEMAKQKVDTSKLPLGKLSKAQISKGNSVLAKLKAELSKGKQNITALQNISSEFFTLIPHNFGWKKPQPISTMAEWNEKVDLINTLNDIELAQHLIGSGSDPLSDSYKKLNNSINVLPTSTKEYKAIAKYFECTKPGSGSKLLKVFSLDRACEKTRMAANKFGNRRLLWHGTSPAVVAAILKSGLRIMPHSGGRVGKGIYLASENSKSAGYTGSTKVGSQNAGFMFLVEAPLGKMHSIDQDGKPSTFTAAPGGCQSVKAEGHRESFDPKTDTNISGPFGPVSVPQKKPTPTSFKGKSSFFQSEYLVYKESQAMLRYLCVVKLH